MTCFGTFFDRPGHPCLSGNGWVSSVLFLREGFAQRGPGTGPSQLPEVLAVAMANLPADLRLQRLLFSETERVWLFLRQCW